MKKMTYATAKKELKELYALLNERPYHTEVRMVENYGPLDGGKFSMPLGTYSMQSVQVYDTLPASYVNKIKKKIIKLEAIIADEEQERYNKAKYKRYIKETAELKETLEYKLAWIKAYEKEKNKSVKIKVEK